MRFVAVGVAVCVLGLAGTLGSRETEKMAASEAVRLSGESKHGLLYARLTERSEGGVVAENRGTAVDARRSGGEGDSRTPTLIAGRSVSRAAEAGVRLGGGTRQRGADRTLAHFGHAQTWFSRHAPDLAKARILRLRIKHAADVERFFANHPRLANTKAGRRARWQHGRMGRWARRELKRVLWRPPLLAGEREWHASMRNPVNRNLWRLAVCETGGINGGRPLWTHRNSTYEGALGFAVGTWAQFRHAVKPLPPRHAYDATAGQQLAVGRALVRRFGGYSAWPSCHRRLGLG